jgi:hypothetical protein
MRYVKDYDVDPTRSTISVTVTVGWLLILAFLCLFWGAVIWGLLHMAGEL